MRDDYIKAKKLGDRSVRRAVSSGKYPYLLSLDSMLPIYDKLSKYPVGLLEIPLHLIAGTVTTGRQNAFSWDFYPILADSSEFGIKWSNLYDSQAAEGIREPIKVFEYMNQFYVLEGNKRVSVLKSVGAYSVLADIQRIIPAESTDKEYRVYQEFLQFFQSTRLYEPIFSERDSYRKVAQFYGETLDQDWAITSIESLRSDFSVFQEHFLAKGGDRLSMTVGDAFLIYRSIYKGDNLQENQKQMIERHISAIWDELMSVTNIDTIARIEHPDSADAAPMRSTIGTLFSSLHNRTAPLRVAFIYSGNPVASRWVYIHELGRHDLEVAYEEHVETFAYEDCDTDEKVDQAFAFAAEAKADVVFTASPAMMDAAMRAAIQYPSMKILNCSINLASSRVRTYYPKMYEAKMLMGALAASYCDDHRIGYVADYPLYGSLANVNAFAIGAALIDPQVKIYLKWSGKKDCDWEGEMRELGLTTISGPDTIRPQDASRKYGVYKISYGEDDAQQPSTSALDGTINKELAETAAKTGSDLVKNLAAPIYNWGKYYTRIIGAILSGSWASREQVNKNTAVNYWYGMSAGVIDVIFSDELPYYSRKLMHLLRDGILADTIHPFRGEVHSQDGTLSREGAPAFVGEQIITMDWLNDNIIGSIPSIDELIPSVQESIRKSGVTE